ncbi:MAG: hypothetical protein Q7T56_17445 [Nocardioidaceae bacterium]|nr:hypothetical protein [Nocardioidaceae bacterium]
MKTSSITRAGARVAVVGATAVALMIGTSGLAGADDTTSVSATLTSTAAPASAARKAPYITKIASNDVVVSSKAAQKVTTAFNFRSVPAGTASARSNISRGGKVLTVSTYGSTSRGSFTYRPAYGRGAFVVGPTTFYDAAGQRLAGDDARATFHVRSDSRGKLKISSTGSSKRAKANVRIWSTAKGRYVSAKRVRLQVLSGGSWTTKKTIKLNAKGTGYYSFRSSTAKKYRIVLKTTATVAGAKTSGLRI